MRSRVPFVLALIGSGLAIASVAAAPRPTPAAPAAPDAELFEKEVRPVLAEHCYSCHGAKIQQGGLRLDNPAALRKGMEGGRAAFVPGDPEKSPLIQVLRYDGAIRMPPQGKLPVRAIAALTAWVKQGAALPGSAAVTTAHGPMTPAEARQKHWAFRPIQDPPLPAVRDNAWCRTPLDRFVLARLETKGLRPNPPADRRTLIRRAHFDLTGLPPTPEEVEAFVHDARPDAFARVVDRLLASPHYGERWGRHWLDVARYSDGYGSFLDPEPLPGAYRYRDWVVSAFNRDLPFPDFVKQQIVGDLQGTEEGAAACGFLALGPTYQSDGGDPDSVAQARAQTLDDRVDTLTRGFLGLTVSCARCHDHKFDAIPTQDYYSLAGIFNNTRAVERPVAPPDVVARVDAAHAAIAELDRKVRALQAKPGGKLSPADERALETMRAELEHLRKTAPPPYPVMHTLADAGSADMPIALRGNLRKPGEMAPRRFLRVVAGDDPPHFTHGSGRQELADAVADPANPLTPRVLVNRVWLWHFGQGLVRTPSNFGALGQKPTHPELLDWLASRFAGKGLGSTVSGIGPNSNGAPHRIGPIPYPLNPRPWSVKDLHRLIMLSATYQQSSDLDARKFAVDGENALLWRVAPRRLDVESWRDGLLAVTGELDEAVGGPPMERLLAGKRRTLYAMVSRSGDRFESDEFLRLFDFPSPRASSEQRSESTVPQQYLFMLNSPFMADRARALADRLEREAATNEDRIRRAYGLLYGRAPTAAEARLGLQYLAAPPGDPAGLTPWQRYAQVLLSANEFLYTR